MVKITRRGKKAWVTFTAPVGEGETLWLKGSWNGWEAEPMKRKKSGEFYLTKVLPTGQSYEFGYLTEIGDWIVDHDLPLADTPFGSKNSILAL